MAANDKDLKKAKGGLAAPQHYNAKIGDYEYVQGENGASFVAVQNQVTVTPFSNKNIQFFCLLTDTTATSAAQVVASPQLNVTGASKVTIFFQSNNQGTLKVSYSLDGTKVVTQPVTGELNGSVYLYTLEISNPLIWISYEYKETDAAGSVYGGVQIIESTVI